MQKVEPRNLLSNTFDVAGTSKYNERSDGRGLGHEFYGSGCSRPQPSWCKCASDVCRLTSDALDTPPLLPPMSTT